MSKSNNKIIGITIGDPGGIGPEVIACCFKKPSVHRESHFIIIGHRDILNRYSRSWPSHCEILDWAHEPLPKSICGQATQEGARASLSYLEKAIELLKTNKIQGLVTGPVCKETISALGTPFCGHTEYLAQAFGVKKIIMMFVTKKLKTVVATRHIPLSQVSSTLTDQLLWDTIKLSHDGLVNFFKIQNPKIAVCGLNPHAGENGKIGMEEIQTIIPTIHKARRKGMNVFGPFPADTIFYPPHAKDYDIIISLYHDQGLIALKTQEFHDLVNLTIGLPFVRTSPAHGTAFSLAGKNKANPFSTLAAITWAAQLTASS